MARMVASSRAGGSKKQILVTQDDFYDDAVAKEEQAERWALSDIKKTIRHYLLAFESYEKGLRAPEATLSGSCHIYYNQTRLLLKMHTDFVANDGHINILQYVNLADLGDLTVLFRPLKSIVERFELTIAEFKDECSWDLHFNLLTCYYSLLEDYESLTGEEVLQVFEKFKILGNKLIQLHVQELESWDVTSGDDATADQQYGNPAVPETSSQNADAGVQEPESVEMQDEITAWTLVDTLSMCYRCISTIMEILIETNNGTLNTMNPIQVGYLNDSAQALKSQLNLFLNSTTYVETNSADTEELNLAIWSIEGLKVAVTDGYEGVKSFMSNLQSAELEKLLIAVDILHLTAQSFQQNSYTQLWAVYTEIARILSAAESQVAQKRQDIISGRLKDKDNELSPTVFQLCDVMISRSDNELFRHMLKTSQLNSNDPSTTDASNAKTAAVLLKNAQVLLKNAKAIAEKPCGFREYISDKLKRNYVFKQAEDRLEFMNSGKATPTILELAQSNPFYTSISSARNT
ncbi:LAME_0F16380g1_1 [Lachancea meyersii CBS 8951]|uniref:LAME_0F16380g1_1 n=1 Tax=Lachancea meyersii CBS 8951 TaxID=1266667 RepID=A0A1G4JZ55_9SACH|nr:LAME_0F16380g1_1 [Lachancea meyersii CBS 8951]